MTKLSLCLICRDNERTIRPCLESIRPWVDEMVVVDTGSTDQTPQIAAELGARLFHIEWCDDFAAARNESLRHACGEWLFWMDSDDTISEANGRKLRELAFRRHGPRTLGFVMQVECPGERAGDLTVVVLTHIGWQSTQHSREHSREGHSTVGRTSREDKSGSREGHSTFLLEHSREGHSRTVGRDTVGRAQSGESGGTQHFFA